MLEDVGSLSADRHEHGVAATKNGPLEGEEGAEIKRESDVCHPVHDCPPRPVVVYSLSVRVCHAAYRQRLLAYFLVALKSLL